jgi:hypothetical protein
MSPPHGAPLTLTSQAEADSLVMTWDDNTQWVDIGNNNYAVFNDQGPGPDPCFNGEQITVTQQIVEPTPQNVSQIFYLLTYEAGAWTLIQNCQYTALFDGTGFHQSDQEDLTAWASFKTNIATIIGLTPAPTPTPDCAIPSWTTKRGFAEKYGFTVKAGFCTHEGYKVKYGF